MVTDIEINLTRELATDGEGNYVVADLIFGDYKVTVSIFGLRMPEVPLNISDSRNS